MIGLPESQALLCIILVCVGQTQTQISPNLSSARRARPSSMRIIFIPRRPSYHHLLRSTRSIWNAVVSRLPRSCSGDRRVPEPPNFPLHCHILSGSHLICHCHIHHWAEAGAGWKQVLQQLMPRLWPNVTLCEESED